MSGAFEQWQDGTLSPTHALRAVAFELAELESDLEPMKAQQQAIRDQLSIIIDRVGPSTVPGFGKLEMTSPSLTKSYDKKQLDELVMQLVADGYGPIAEQIVQCRTESPRAGGLRITREKRG